MKWSDMNIDILAHLKPAYTLSVAKSPLASFEYDRELYLGEGKEERFKSRENYKERHGGISYLNFRHYYFLMFGFSMPSRGKVV